VGREGDEGGERMTTNPRQSATEPRHWSDECAASATQLAQAQARCRALEAERDELDADRAAIVEALLSTGVEPASGDPVQLVYQVRELVRELRAELIRLANALREIRVEAEEDRDWDIITTAARGALEGVEDE